MNIGEFRRQYPQYDDMSDADLARSLHSKHYSDMPEADFMRQFGVGGTATPQQASPVGVGEAGTFLGPGDYRVDSQDKNSTGYRAITNIPSSGVRFVSELGNALLHPIDTASALGNTALGGVQKLIPGEQPSEHYFDALVNHMGQRYGSPGAAQETLASDPIGMLGDIASVLGGGGAALRGVGGASRAFGAAGMGEKIVDAGRMASRAAEVLDPVNIAKQAVVRPAAGLMGGDIAQKMYMSALKPSIASTTPAERARMFDAAVSADAPVSKSGIEKIQGAMENQGKAIADVIDAGATVGDAISTDDVLRSVDRSRGFYSNTANPAGPMRQVENAATQFRDAFGDSIPVDQAQTIKKNTQRELSKKYGNDVKPIDEARKDIAHGIRVELERLYPELAGMNQAQGANKMLFDELMRQVNRIENRDIIGLTAAQMAAAGGVAAGPAGGAVSLVSNSVLRMPAVKSRLALALAQARKNPNYGLQRGGGAYGAINAVGSLEQQ